MSSTAACTPDGSKTYKISYTEDLTDPNNQPQLGARQRTRAWRDDRAWSGRYGLRGLGDGDGEAERFDLPDVVADLAVGVGAGLVVAVAEVGVAGGGVGEQVPDDDQDGAGDGDLGLGLAAAAGDPGVAFAEEGSGAGGAGGGLAEVAAQPGVALALLPGPGAGGGLAGGGAQPRPGHQVAGGGEPAHSQAYLGDDGAGQVFADAGDLRQPRHGVQHRGVRSGPGTRAGGPVGVDAPGSGHRRGQLGGPGGELGDPVIAEGDLVQQQLGELAVVIVEHAVQGLHKVVVLGFDPGAGQGGQRVRVALAGDQRLDHVPG